MKPTHRRFQRQISDHAKAQLEKTRRVTLGIAICGALTEPGTKRTRNEIAAFANCSEQAIAQIEYEAIKKLRRAALRDPDLNAYRYAQ